MNRPVCPLTMCLATAWLFWYQSYFPSSITRYWQLDLNNVPKGKEKWDKSVSEASEEYKHRMVNNLIYLRLIMSIYRHLTFTKAIHQTFGNVTSILDYWLASILWDLMRIFVSKIPYFVDTDPISTICY